MAELGKPDRCILLSLRRMSTVEIRAGSEFHTSQATLCPCRGGFGTRAGSVTPRTHESTLE